MSMHPETSIELKRDCDAIQIPSGQKLVLPAGTLVRIGQELGGTYTVVYDGGLARIDGKDADALGLEAKRGPASQTGGIPRTREELEKEIWNQMRSVYDPEIPVNIVDLGLIYDCQVQPKPEAGHDVSIKMTLTAPGCGMGEVLKQDVENRVRYLEGVQDVNVELVWEPQWNQSMMTDAARLQLGLM